MIVIRKAAKSDIPTLLQFGRDFLAQTAWAKVGIDDDSLSQTFTGLLSSDTGILLVAEQDGKIIGSAAAFSFPHYFNLNVVTAQEAFWWVEPEARGSSAGKGLFKGLEQWAQSIGANSLMMVSLPSVPGSEMVDAMYTRAGYEPAEHSFVRFF